MIRSSCKRPLTKVKIQLHRHNRQPLLSTISQAACFSSTKLAQNSSSNKETVQTVDYKSTINIPPNSTIFSMIQPTNRFHIGNYLGTIKIWRDFANNDQLLSPQYNTKLLFGIADLHAITTPKPDPLQFKKARIEAIASIIASGISPEKAIIFTQSAIPEHSELFWIMSCLSGMGYLNRMTQWKSKSAGVSSTDSVFDEEILKKTKAGVFMYPVLQAADILLYQSTHVPVGEDQAQHLELCRHVCNLFNKQYGNAQFKFPEPRTVLAPTKKILSLRDPLKKMSKSDADQNSCIYITEDANTIQRKLRKAVTDSITDEPWQYDPAKRPGVSNLINIVSGLTNQGTDLVVQQLHAKGVADHKQLKDYVSDVVIKELAGAKNKFEELMDNEEYLLKVIDEGNLKAREIAVENIKRVKQCIGLA